MLQRKPKKLISKLDQKKYRKELGLFVIEGIKLAEEALNSGVDIELLVIEEKRKNESDINKLVNKLNDLGVEIEYCSTKEAKEIKKTEVFPGVLLVVKYKNHLLKDLDLKKPVIFLNKVSDPGNLGTIIRTADWFGIDNIVLDKGSVDPHNDKVLRSTMGSIFRTKIVTNVPAQEALEFLAKNGYDIVSFSMNGENMDKANFSPKTVLVFGSESHGINPDILDKSAKTLSIPGTGRAESLNVAVSAGIVLNKIFKL